MKDQLQMQRVDERIAFLWTRCSAQPSFDYRVSFWADFKEGLRLRNALTHPKEHLDLSPVLVERSILAVIDAIDTLFSRIYSENLPAKIRGLHSKLNF